MESTRNNSSEYKPSASDVEVWQTLRAANAEESPICSVGHFLFDRPLDRKATQELFITAVSDDTADNVRLLLDAGADPNHPIEGVYALILAVETNNLECVDMLLKAGARTDVESTVGVSALGKSVMYCTLLNSSMPTRSSMEMLLAYGADPNRTDSFNMSPLHHAIGHHNHLAVEKLLLSGADVNLMSGNSIVCALIPHMDACFHVCPPTYDLPRALLSLMAGLKYSCKLHGQHMYDLIMKFLDNTKIIWYSFKDSSDDHRWESYLDIVRMACSVGYTPSMHQMDCIIMSYPQKRYKMRLRKFRDHPRALKDLCRLYIRSSMSGNMFSEVALLPLPNDIKDFILIRSRVYFTRI